MIKLQLGAQILLDKRREERNGGSRMVDFLDFESLYEHLEAKAMDYENTEIACMFQKILGKMHEEKKADLETQAKWEMDVFNFTVEKNIISPLKTVPNQEGKLVSYPNYDSFTPSAYEYIAKRIDSTSNPLLRARYAHFLWFSPKKHGKYALLAVDSYLQMAKIYEQKDRENPEQFIGLEIAPILENAFLLSKNVNDKAKIDLVKSEVRRLVLNFNPASECLFKLRIDLLSLMLQEKIFSKEDFNGLSELCFSFAKELDSHQSITILIIGEKIEQKLETVNFDWNTLLAKTYENMMRANLEKNKHVVIEFCQRALEYYRLSKNQAKIDELQAIYDEFKGTVEFKEISVELDLRKYIADCEIRAKKVAQYPAEEIIGILMSDKSLLPEYTVMEEFAQKRLQNSLKSILPIARIDEQGHTAQHFSSEEEIEFHEILTQYRIYLENHYCPFIDLIFIEALKEKKITFLTLMNFFQKYSWFSKPIERKIYNKSISRNWLNLVAPALFDYFSQMDYFLASGEYPNLVLCIDSLTLKIEGLFRDLFFFSGITTSHSKKDKQNQISCRENDLTRLLHERRVKKLFDRDELLFFRFVLVEKAGYNLRNRVAHSFLFRGEYQIRYIHLLLMILLKLGQYDLRPKNAESKESS
jgi:hypothetical protein